MSVHSTTIAFLLTVLVLGAPRAQAMPEFKCHAKIKIKKAIVGERGEYEVKKGLAVSKRSGFLKRQPLRPSKGCLFAGLKAGQCVVMHLPKKAFDRGHGLKVQCVESDNPSTVVKTQMQGALGYSMKSIDGYQFLLFGKNKTGYPSDDGDNGARGSKLEKQLAKKDLIMRSFCVPRALTKFAKTIGKKIFCQWFHMKDDAVVFAAEYVFEGPK